MIIKAMILFPQASITLVDFGYSVSPFRFIVPICLSHLAFQSCHFECTMMNISPETPVHTKFDIYVFKQTCTNKSVST